MSTRYRRPEPDPYPHTQLPLAVLETAPASARGHANVVALTWGMSKEQREVAELLVSELVTNGMVASLPQRMPERASWLAERTPDIELRLTRRPDRMLIEVWDASPYPPPRPGQPDDDMESGRGLFMVEQLSMRWSFYYPAFLSEVEPPVLGFNRFQPSPRPIEIGERVLTGKVVWCEVAMTDAAASAAF
jgi:anti-sigma regulatory factor (Ser/Thr protein kinase)